ncbi:MAG: matrixin family metalloprotease, partial [Nitriliruptorales bacterium]|nr:matrixin family metalloprotease [Nitriliruptorales bacterium]
MTHGLLSRVGRFLATALATYLLMATVVGVAPAFAETPELTPASEPDPFSIVDLVEYLDEQEEHNGDQEEHNGDSEHHAAEMSVSYAPDVPVGTEHALTDTLLQPVVDQAIADWQAVVPDADFSSVTFTISDLTDLQVGDASGTSISIDIDGAGHGWSVTFPSEEASEHLDLLTVVRHELGHVLGYEHTTDGLMEPTIVPGETHEVPTSTSDSTTDSSTTDVPDLVVTPTTVDFGDVEVGTSATVTLTLANEGSADLNLTGL